MTKWAGIFLPAQNIPIMKPNNISNLISSKAKKLFILGFYLPKDFYFAHLLEHYLAVDFGKKNLIKIDQANIGGGYIFIDGDILSVTKIIKTIKSVDKINIDLNSLEHQKKIVITEKLYRNKADFDRDIYESLETNSYSLIEKNKLFDDFFPKSFVEVDNEWKKLLL